MHTLRQNLQGRYQQFIRSDGTIMPQRALPGPSAPAESSAPPPAKALPPTTYREVDGLGNEVARGKPPQVAPVLQPLRVPAPPAEAPTDAIPPPPPPPASAPPAQIREFMAGHAVEREHGYERARLMLNHAALDASATNASRIEACHQLASYDYPFRVGGWFNAVANERHQTAPTTKEWTEPPPLNINMPHDQLIRHAESKFIGGVRSH